MPGLPAWEGNPGSRRTSVYWGNPGQAGAGAEEPVPPGGAASTPWTELLSAWLLSLCGQPLCAGTAPGAKEQSECGWSSNQVRESPKRVSYLHATKKNKK